MGTNSSGLAVLLINTVPPYAKVPSTPGQQSVKLCAIGNIAKNLVFKLNSDFIPDSFAT